MVARSGRWGQDLLQQHQVGLHWAKSQKSTLWEKELVAASSRGEAPAELREQEWEDVLVAAVGAVAEDPQIVFLSQVVRTQLAARISSVLMHPTDVLPLVALQREVSSYVLR